MLRTIALLDPLLVPLVVPLLVPNGALAPAGHGSADVQVTAYELDVRFEPADGTLRGRALVLIDPDVVDGDRLTFHLHGELEVERVLVDGHPVTTTSEPVFYDSDYSLVATRVTFPLEGRDVGAGVEVTYAGPFHASRARSPSDYMRIDADGVHLRSFGYSLWFPVFLGAEADSHAVSFLSVRLDVPAEFVPVFTGTFLEETVAGGRRVSEWEAECDLFDAQCTARRFTVTEEEGTFVYALEDAASRAVVPTILGFAGRFTELCRASYGPGAGATQTHVLQMTAFGDIASGNAIGISEGGWRGFASGGARTTLAHELVHAFVSVPVKRADPLYALVVEGFPSYFHLPVLDALGDEGLLERALARTEREYLARRSSGRPLPEVPLTAIGADDVGTYKDRFVLNDRAPLFCHWLGRRMGSEGFGAFLRALFALDELDRAAFEALVEEHLPGSRDDVALWLDTTEFPERFRLSG
jgi:hypothetical protein